MKKARYIGKVKNVTLQGLELDLWSCQHCDSLFQAAKELRGKVTECQNCKEKIQLEIY